METRTLIRTKSVFEEEIGYARAVVCGNMVFVSGCTGYDYATGTIAPDVEAQADQAMRNAAAALAGAGACLRHAVRVRYVLPDKQDFPRIWPVLRRWWIGSDGEDGDDAGGSRPAATMIQAGLMEDVMRIEIEVTAVKPATGTGVAFETVML